MGRRSRKEVQGLPAAPSFPACDTATRVLAAEAMLKRLEALAGEAEGVALGEDIECVHRMRVASRRLRTALELFGDCFPARRARTWAKGIKRVTRRLGQARDADVQILFIEQFLADVEDPKARPGLARLLLRLKQHRQGLQAGVVTMLDRLRESSLVDEMTHYLLRVRARERLTAGQGEAALTPILLQRAVCEITARLEELLAYEPFLDQPQAAAEHHAMRIAAKHLRYAMEVFEPLHEHALGDAVRAARKLQTTLGEIHDCDVWLQSLPEFLDQERRRAIEYFGSARGQGRLPSGICLLERHCAARRVELFEQLGRDWARFARKGVWRDMLAALADRPTETAPAPSEDVPAEPAPPANPGEAE